MDHPTQDTIEKEIFINATQQTVYNAIADPSQITKWFPSAIEGTLNPGDDPILDFSEHGKNQIYVEAANPYAYFAYRWVPGSKHFIGDVRAQANTLVEFTIEATADGTMVKLKESGFAALPADIRAEKFADNNGGWDYMLGRLTSLLTNV